MDGAARLEQLVGRCLCSLDGGSTGLVLAVSGGPDSVALLRLTLAARDPHLPVTIAHLNHQLRGTDSDGDEEFVVRLHAALSSTTPNLALRTARLDVAALARAEDANLEATARAARYRWLTAVAQEAGAHWIATGHTANDQAETVLHRVLRGTGLQGLRGIAERRPLTENTFVVRPLLSVLRDDLLAYLRQIGQDAREDSSNSDLRYTRNRIRRDLLPHLATTYNPAIVSVLGRLAQANESHHHEEAEAAELLRSAELPRAGTMLVFDAVRLRQAPRPVVRGMFRLVWTREIWPTGEMDFEAWKRLTALVIDAVGGGDFPGGVHVRCRGRVVQLERHDPSRTPQ